VIEHRITPSAIHVVSGLMILIYPSGLAIDVEDVGELPDLFVVAARPSVDAEGWFAYAIDDGPVAGCPTRQ